MKDLESHDNIDIGNKETIKDLESQKNLTIKTVTEKHPTNCHVQDCKTTLDEMAKICGYDFKQGCINKKIGCAKHFCSNHRTVNEKN